VKTVLLLAGSNLFMTFAWYGHLRQRQWSMMIAILISWLIALPEYCLQVPANRLGYGSMTGYQLKILQECISISVFAGFAAFYLGEGLRWNYVLSFVCLLGAAYFAFGMK
jgi:uncharacterized protein (DUF486 family)